MRARTRTRWGCVAIGLTAAGAATAQPPVPIEVYHGTTLVSPAPRAWEPRPFPAPVVPAAAVHSPEPAALPAPPIPEPSRAVQPLLFPVPQVVVVPNPAAPPGPVAPAVVVVKEPPPAAPPALAPAARTGGVMEWLLAGSVGAGLAFLGALAARRPRAAPAFVPATPPPAAAEPYPASRLIDGFDIGPASSTAQKFDVGPSYQESRQEQERAEEQAGAAVLEFVLRQNLALRDQLAAEPPEPTPVDGFGAWVEASKDRGRTPQPPHKGS